MTIRAEHVVPYIGNEFSGPAWSVPALCSALLKHKAHVRLHILGPAPERDFEFKVREYPWHLLPHKRLGNSPEMKRGLREAADSADILHNHSLWMMPNIYPANAVRGNDCRGRSNISVYDYALSNIDVGTITLYTPLINGFPNYGETSITEPEGGAHAISEAKVMSLDKAIEHHDKVRFIKCDVEGHELQVFQGAMNILHKSRPFILAEVNVSRDDLFDFFYNLEYLAYYFNGTHLIRTKNKA